MSDEMRLVFLGAPGAGKGTYAGPLSQHWQVPTISTGDLLRVHVKQQSTLGKQAKTFMDQGALVPDELVTSMVADRLRETDAATGFILDGFPRTLQQAEDLRVLLEKNNGGLTAVINIEVPQDQLLRRLTGRRVCPNCRANYNVNTNLRPAREGICDQCGSQLVQRSDDTEETISRRLQIYQEQTAPLIEYYRKAGLLRTVKAAGEIPEIVNMIRAAAEWNQ